MIKSFFLKALKFYKKNISPSLPRACRYMPTCSEYAYEAIAVHGVIKGFFLSLYRVLRCNPFSKGGYDPVPLKKGFVRSEEENCC